MTRYSVYDLDLDDEVQNFLGEVELDVSHMLQILSAEDDAARERMEEAVQEINGKDALIVKLPPNDDSDDDDRSSLRKEAVPRGDSGFFDAIQDNLKRWHNMTLMVD